MSACCDSKPGHRRNPKPSTEPQLARVKRAGKYVRNLTLESLRPGERSWFTLCGAFDGSVFFCEDSATFFNGTEPKEQSPRKAAVRFPSLSRANDRFSTIEQIYKAWFIKGSFWTSCFVAWATPVLYRCKIPQRFTAWFATGRNCSLLHWPTQVYEKLISFVVFLYCKWLLGADFCEANGFIFWTTTRPCCYNSRLVSSEPNYKFVSNCKYSHKFTNSFTLICRFWYCFVANFLFSVFWVGSDVYMHTKRHTLHWFVTYYVVFFTIKFISAHCKYRYLLSYVLRKIAFMLTML